MTDVLDEIVAKKRQEIQGLARLTQAAVRPSTRDFGHFIATGKQEVAMIAEIKRKTPFRGPLTRKQIQAADLARLYEHAGAAAISVLTDETFFGGSLKDLQEASDAVALPVLRKDFILDPRQIYEARAYGADAILLIARCLTDEELISFRQTSEQLHMRALVEIHHETELERALRSGAQLIGINSRNLADGSIDLEATLALAKKVPSDRIVVAESGIQGPTDVTKFLGIADALLVGSALMTAPNVEQMLCSLVAAGEKIS